MIILVSKLSGIGTPTEATSRFQTCQSYLYIIVCLQDVHIQSHQESYTKADLGNDAYFSCFNSSSRGVLISLNNNFEFKVK